MILPQLPFRNPVAAKVGEVAIWYLEGVVGEEDIYQCPHCQAVATLDDCDCIGADEDCVFCPECQEEFSTR